MAYTRPSSSSTALPEPFRHENLDLESGHILQKIEDLKNTVATLEDERRQLWSIFESLTPRSIPYASLPTLKERVSAAKETLLSYVMFPNLAVWAQQETAFDHIIAAQKRATDLEEKLTKIALLAAKATSATRHTIKNIPTIGSSPCPVSQISLEYEDKAIQSGVEATIDHTRVNQRHGTRTDLEEKLANIALLAEGETLSPSRAIAGTPTCDSPIATPPVTQLPVVYEDKSIQCELIGHSQTLNPKKSKVACQYPGCGAKVRNLSQHTRHQHSGAFRIGNGTQDESVGLESENCSPYAGFRFEEKGDRNSKKGTTSRAQSVPPVGQTEGDPPRNDDIVMVDPL